MWYVPIGLIFLISNKIMEIEDDMGSTWKALDSLLITQIKIMILDI